MISSCHLAITLLFDVSRQWSLYLNRCVAALVPESLDALGSNVPFSLKPIMVKLEGGRYIVPILPTSLSELVANTDGRGGDSVSRGGGGGGGGRDGSGSSGCS